MRGVKYSRDRCLVSILNFINGERSNLPQQTYTFDLQRIRNFSTKRKPEGEVWSIAANMSVKITSDFILNLMNQAAAGNPVPLVEALNPEVHWRIGSDTKDEVAKTGIYVSISTTKGGRRRFCGSQLVVMFFLHLHSCVCMLLTRSISESSGLDGASLRATAIKTQGGLEIDTT
jgi:hypothetical protein